MIDNLELSEEDVNWSYEIQTNSGKKRTLYLDGRISIACVQNQEKQSIIRDWIQRVAIDLGVAESIRKTLTGVIFEVRQGYKSKDSKRQNADIAKVGFLDIKIETIRKRNSKKELVEFNVSATWP